MNEKLSKVATIIPAAGFSERMKYPKPLLKFDKENTFIEKIINTYNKFGCGRIVITYFKSESWKDIITKHQNDIITFVENEHPDYERFYSVKLGVSVLKDYEFCFLQNSDNPFVDTELIKKIYNGRNKNGFSVPVFQGKGGHPVILNNEICEAVSVYPDDRAILKNVLMNFNRKDIQVCTDKIHININTQEDYYKLFPDRGE